MLPEGKCRYIDGPLYPDGNFYVLDTEHIKHNGGKLKTALSGIDARVTTIEETAVSRETIASETDTITIPYTDAGLYLLSICATDSDQTKYAPSAYLLRIDGGAWVTLISSPVAAKSIGTYTINENAVVLTMNSVSNYLASLIKL